MPEMKPVFSSLVQSVGYDPESQELSVRYKPSKKRPDGALCIYSGVPPDLGNSILNAHSVGSAINETIKGSYAFRYA